MKTQSFGCTVRPFLPPIIRAVCCSLSRCATLTQKNYRENRENGSQQDNPKSSFPSGGFDSLDIKDADAQDWSKKWPDAQGRYWWKFTLSNGQVVNDFYWMEDKARGYPDKSDSNCYWFTVHHAPTNTKIEGFSQEPDYQKGFPDKDKKYWYTVRFDDTHCPAIRQWMEEKDFNYLKRLRVENPALFSQELADLKSKNPQHPAIAKLDVMAKQEESAREAQQRAEKERLAQKAREEAEKKRLADLQKAKEEAEKQARLEEAKHQEDLANQRREKEKLELELEITRLREQLVLQQQSSPAKPATPTLPSKIVEKQKSTSKPYLQDDMIGQLGLTIRYEDIILHRELGEGAFGVVSQGQWQFEDVAVKKLHLQKMSEKALIEFKEEAAIMARLRSDYIVLLKGICLTPYALVMEYMRGGSLFELLHSQNALPWAIRNQIALDVAKGLAFLHHRQPPIIHRDLKSQNVLLNQHANAKIADFGLATVRVESSRSQCYAQSANKSVGTIPWMAPECFGIRPKYSEKSDMYAYGMVLWELTSRKMPYQDVTEPTEIRDAVKDGEREEIPDETTNPSETIPISYKKFIRVCWFQSPEQRPSAKEAIEVLQQTSQSASSSSSQRSSSSSGSSSGYPSGFMSNLSSFK